MGLEVVRWKMMEGQTGVQPGSKWVENGEGGGGRCQGPALTLRTRRMEG